MPTTSSEEHAVIASEPALYYHNVKISLLYNGFGCNTKLSRHILSGSKERIKLSCGRTKAALVTYVSAPSRVTNFLGNFIACQFTLIQT
jgi:hypothetical protein